MRYSIVRLLLTLVLFLSYILLPQYSFPGGGFVGHLLYPLSHANIWHLLANVLCLWLVRCDLHLLTCWLLSVLCSYIPSLTSEATMGFSGILFATVGMSWGMTGRFVEMLKKNKWFLIIPFAVPHVNAFIHIYCMLSGWLVGYNCRCKSFPELL